MLEFRESADNCRKSQSLAPFSRNVISNSQEILQHIGNVKNNRTKESLPILNTFTSSRILIWHPAFNFHRVSPSRRSGACCTVEEQRHLLLLSWLRESGPLKKDPFNVRAAVRRRVFFARFVQPVVAAACRETTYPRKMQHSTKVPKMAVPILAVDELIDHRTAGLALDQHPACLPKANCFQTTISLRSTMKQFSYSKRLAFPEGVLAECDLR